MITRLNNSCLKGKGLAFAFCQCTHVHRHGGTADGGTAAGIAHLGVSTGDFVCGNNAGTDGRTVIAYCDPEANPIACVGNGLVDFFGERKVGKIANIFFVDTCIPGEIVLCGIQVGCWGHAAQRIDITVFGIISALVFGAEIIL